MKRRLIAQMCCEWRGNLWMIIELVIVSVVLWLIFWLFTEIVEVRTQHYGYNLDDIYVADIKFVPLNSSEYQPYDSAHSYYTDLAMLRSRIGSDPRVELVGIGINALPYNYNYAGWGLSFTENDSTYQYSGNVRRMTPEVAKIIRLEGEHGETPEQLAAMLERNELLISKAAQYMYDPAPNPEDFINKQTIMNDDSTTVRKVGALVHGIRRSDYEPIFGGMIIVPLAENEWGHQMIIRVKPDTGRQFIESLKAADMEQGNVYLSNLQSIDRMRDIAHVDINSTIRGLSVCAIFIMLVIFLGFLGTFWFRTQQRVTEIAVRKVNGATRSDIFRRLISEGLLMLMIASVPAWTIIYALIQGGDLDWGISDNEYAPYIAAAITTAVLATMITAGIWIPARKAMNVNPASALKDQ